MTIHPEDHDLASDGPVSRFRWVVCAMLFFAATINYMDRQVLSILAPTLQEKFGWTEAQYAHIVTMFQMAYAVSLLLAGRLIDRIGIRLGYALTVLLWSLVAMGHALVQSAFGFGVMRFALGLTEAGNWPAAIKAVSEWFPEKERALATGLFNTGSMAGAIVTPAVVPWLERTYGWQSTFIILGAVGLVWLAVWWTIYSSPQDKRGRSAAEHATSRSDSPEPPREKLHWFRLLRHRAVWAFAVGKFLSDPIWWFFLFWLAKFLSKQYGLNLMTISLPLVVIYTIAAAGSILGGWFSEQLINWGWNLNFARKSVMLLCALAVVPVFFATQTSSLWTSVLLIGLAMAGHTGWMANLFALVPDIFPKKAVASVTGIGGTAGSVGGVLMAEATGWVLEETGDYWLMFAFASCSFIIAWVIICILVPKIEQVSVD